MPSRDPLPATPPAADDAAMMAALGRRIGERRHARGLTLVQLAGMAGLSQPFLSQIERGRARPSMGSLHKIAKALGTETPALLSGPVDDTEDLGRSGVSEAEVDTSRVSLVRADEGSMLSHPTGQVKALVAGARSMYPLEFLVRLTEYEDYYEHPQAEFIYVISGCIQVDLDGEGEYLLSPSDTLYFAGGVRHRWRVRGLWPARLLVTQAGPAAEEK